MSHPDFVTGMQIKAAHALLGRTQADVAQATGLITSRNIGNVERGRRREFLDPRYRIPGPLIVGVNMQWKAPEPPNADSADPPPTPRDLTPAVARPELID